MTSAPVPDGCKTDRPIRLARIVWLPIGGLSLGLAALGVVVPVLPTTPFVLLAAFAFARSSPRLRRWLTRHRVFGPMIADWETRGAIALRYKIIACCMMGAVLTGSLLADAPTPVILVQLVCMMAAAIFVLTRPGTP